MALVSLLYCNCIFTEWYDRFPARVEVDIVYEKTPSAIWQLRAVYCILYTEKDYRNDQALIKGALKRFCEMRYIRTSFSHYNFVITFVSITRKKPSTSPVSQSPPTNHTDPWPALAVPSSKSNELHTPPSEGSPPVALTNHMSDGLSESPPTSVANTKKKSSRYKTEGMSRK